MQCRYFFVILAGDSKCTTVHGICQDDSRHCHGGYISNLCAGPTHRRCCIQWLTRKRHSGVYIGFFYLINYHVFWSDVLRWTGCKFLIYKCIYALRIKRDKCFVTLFVFGFFFSKCIKYYQFLFFSRSKGTDDQSNCYVLWYQSKMIVWKCKGGPARLTEDLIL